MTDPINDPSPRAAADDLIAGGTVNQVRVEVYRSFIEEGRSPMPIQIATRLDLGVEEVEAALTILHQEDVIALAPGTHFVWLAHPFSALNGPFMVNTPARSWDAI